MENRHRLQYCADGLVIRAVSRFVEFVDTPFDISDIYGEGADERSRCIRPNHDDPRRKVSALKQYERKLMAEWILWCYYCLSTVLALSVTPNKSAAIGEA